MQLNYSNAVEYEYVQLLKATLKLLSGGGRFPYSRPPTSTN